MFRLAGAAEFIPRRSSGAGAAACLLLFRHPECQRGARHVACCTRPLLDVASTTSNTIGLHHSSSRNLQRFEGGNTDNRLWASIAINRKIVEYGKHGQWRDILALIERNAASNFNNVNYATAMSQLGRIRSLDRSDPRFLAFLDSLSKTITELGFSWVDSRQVGNIVHAIGKMKLSNHTSARQIMAWISSSDSVITTFISQGEPQCITNTVWSFATLGLPAPKLLDAVEQRSEWLVNTGSTQAVANTIWSFATLGVPAPQLCDCIVQRAEWLVQEGTPQHVANTAWAFATLKVKAHTLFATIDDRSDWLVQNGNTQNVANTVWAFATLQMEAPKLVPAIGSRSDLLVQNGTPQEVANIAWALASRKAQAPQFFAQIEARSDWLVWKGEPQNIANTVWACATLKVSAPKLLAQIEARADWLVRMGETQHVANTAWAFATLKTEAPKLLSQIEERSAWLVQNGTTQAVANTAWAFATLETTSPKLLAQIEARSDWLVRNGSAQDVSNTAWAFATLQTTAPTFFAEIEQRAEWLVREGSVQCVSNIAWAFATLNVEAPHFFTALDNNLTHLLAKKVKPQSVANLCHAVAIATTPSAHAMLLAGLWEKAAQLFDEGASFENKALVQLAQSQLFANAWGVALPSCPTESMLRRMKDALASLPADDNVASTSTQEISTALREIGFDHELEVPPESSNQYGMLAVDFACKSRKVAIEYDGDRHFLRSVNSGLRTTSRNGRTKAKRRLLEKLGWTVVNLDFRDHREAQRRSAVKEWLQQVLFDAGVLLQGPHTQNEQ